MKPPLRKLTTFITAPELAAIIGADLDTINNWVQRGIISRVAIGGRQLRARLFSTEEVYKAALTSELVRLGIQPSPASEAGNAVWKEWDRKEVPDGWKVYALVLPSKGKWTVEVCSRKVSGGPLYKLGKLSEIELPKQTFIAIPISDILASISDKLSKLLG